MHDDYSDVGLFGIGKAFKKIGKAVGSVAKGVGKAAGGVAKVAIAPVTVVTKGVSKVVGQIPVIGSPLASVVNLANSPIDLANAIASGERIDTAVVNNLKSQLKSIKEVAPYAQTFVSMVPGIGTGVSAAIGAASALASGAPLSQALVAGIKGALPGGPLAQSAFSIAEAAASGKSLDKVALAALPISPEAKKGIETAVSAARAIAQGKRIDATLADTALAAVPAEYRQATQAAIAVAQGKKLQAGTILKAATSAATPHLKKVGSAVTQKLPPTAMAMRRRPGDVLNVLPGAARRAPVLMQGSGATLVQKLLQRSPGLRSLTDAELAKRFGVRPSTVRQVTRSNQLRSLPFKGISANAAKWVRRFVPLASAASLLDDTRGLIDSGRVYVVEKGDYAGKIALKLTGKESNWPALVRANPQKKTKDSNIGKVWVSLYPGEKLKLPDSWVKPAPVVPAGAPTTDAATVIQAKTILAAWGATDGKSMAGVTGYGSSASDLSAGWNARDGLQLKSFSEWSNVTRKTNLNTDGELTPAHSAALRSWAESAATQSSTPTTPAQGQVPVQLPNPVPGMPPITVPGMPSLPGSAGSGSGPSSAPPAAGSGSAAGPTGEVKADGVSVPAVLAGAGTGYALGGPLGALIGSIGAAVLTSGAKQA